MILFTDENISKNAAFMLRYVEPQHQVRAYLEYFDPGTPDTIWMREVASWNKDETTVIVCGDGRILKNRVEKQVLKECELMFVLLAGGWTNLEWREFAWKIVKVWPDVIRNVEQARYPMVFEVTAGTLKIRSMGRISSL
ncbi:MAG: hypothetical protein A2Z25_19575 [Planctomycetes bacterium RBG_16_55_9]|nr:MAG: hypothetical protein A2Z25_19575 [Planctomycetes bacterium RBG_16_55_9]